MTEAELIQTLTTALADAHLHLSVKQHAPWLHIYVERPIGYTPSYSRMATRLQKAVADLALPNVQMLAINSRIKGADKSDWKTFIDLAQPNRPVSTASDTPTSLGIFETHDDVIPMFAGVSQLPGGYNQLDDDLIIPSSLTGYTNEDSNQTVSTSVSPEPINLLDDVTTRPNFATSSSASRTPMPSAPPLATTPGEEVTEDAIELAASVESQTIAVVESEPTETLELIDLEEDLAAEAPPSKQSAVLPVAPKTPHQAIPPTPSFGKGEQREFAEPISEPLSLLSTVPSQFQLNLIKAASAPPPPSIVEPVDVESEIAAFLESVPELAPKRPDVPPPSPLALQATQAPAPIPTVSPTPEPASRSEPLPDPTPEDEIAAFLAAQDEAPPPPPAKPPQRTAAPVATTPSHATRTPPPLGTDAIPTHPRMRDDPKTMAPSARSSTNPPPPKAFATTRKGAELELVSLRDDEKNRFLTKPTFTQHDDATKTPSANLTEARISDWSLEGEVAPAHPTVKGKSSSASPLAKGESIPPFVKDKSPPAPPLAKGGRGDLHAAPYEPPLTLQPIDHTELPIASERRVGYWKWLLGGFFISLLLVGLAAGGWWLLKEGKVSLPIPETLLRGTSETTAARPPKRVIDADLCISLKKMLEREQTLSIAEMEALLGASVLQAPVTEKAAKGTIYVWQDPSHPKAQLHAVFVEGRLTTIRSCKGVPASP